MLTTFHRQLAVAGSTPFNWATNDYEACIYRPAKDFDQFDQFLCDVYLEYGQPIQAIDTSLAAGAIRSRGLGPIGQYHPAPDSLPSIVSHPIHWLPPCASSHIRCNLVDSLAVWTLPKS